MTHTDVEIEVVDAFTTEVGMGNRAGVVLDASGLTAVEMQRVAAFANFSETAFVLPAASSDHDLHVRYFTPQSEVPICGHATIATHFLRAVRLNLPSGTLRVLTGAGVLPIEIERGDEGIAITMQQQVPSFGAILAGDDRTAVIAALGIGPSDLLGDMPVQIVSTGHGKVIVPVADESVLGRLAPDNEALTRLSARVGCNGFFPVALMSNTGTVHTRGRMFAPAIGINEDPVTGNANGPTGAYLHEYDLLTVDQQASYIAHQGVEMGRPGQMVVARALGPDGALDICIIGRASASEPLRFSLA